ncbi:Aldo/keto reductase [Irpex lacteus]|nr:Aldo/keto reductase [Irpex lacteus]
MAAPVPTFTFNNGVKIPSVGIGCWMGYDGGADIIETMPVCQNAIKNGYRHFDTASGYKNEEFVGKAIRDSGIPRSEFFVTTKLWNRDNGRVREAFEESLAKLGIEYIDLYLMHWPQALIPDKPGSLTGLVPDVGESPTFIESWREMEKLLETGKVRAIGLSNFSIKNLEILLPHVQVVPVTNQVEIHPFLPSFELQKYCQDKGILLTAFSPFGMGNPELFKDPDFVKVAEAHGVSPAQVAISWLVQRGIATFPKSANVDRQKANITLVTLSTEQMSTINAIHKKPGQHKTLLPDLASNGIIFGWSYQQLGWSFDERGCVKESEDGRL